MNSIIKSVLDRIRASKGVMTAKGKLINYTEAHKIQYGLAIGLVTFRLSKLKEQVQADKTKFKEWENSNRHYVEYPMIVGYLVKWPLIVSNMPKLQGVIM